MISLSNLTPQHHHAKIDRPITDRSSLGAQGAHDVWRYYLHALNALACPAIAIDGLGFVLATNLVMEALLDVDIRVENERLMIADPQARNRFEDMLQSLDTTFETTILSYSDPIVIVRSNGRHPVIVTVLPQLLARRNQPPFAFAILTFVCLEQRPSPPTSLLTKIFGLTPAEARLAARLANGSSLDNIAKELRVSNDTIRHQLKAVFLKTDTHRQSQLVALLGRLDFALRPSGHGSRLEEKVSAKLT